MKVFIAAGSNIEKIKENLRPEFGIEVIGDAPTLQEAFDYLEQNVVDVDVVLFMDAAITNMDGHDFRRLLEAFRDMLIAYAHYEKTELKYLTMQDKYKEIFESVAIDNDGNVFDRFKVKKIEKTRLTTIIKFCLGEEDIEEQETEESAETEQKEETKKRRLAIAEEEVEEKEEKKNEEKEEQPVVRRKRREEQIKLDVSNIASISRVIAFTGDRGSGVTSTAVNIATIANFHGLSVCILDLDIERRGLNIYFTKFGQEVDLNEDLSLSLIKCLLRPDLFRENACKIKDNFYVITLALSVDKNSEEFRIIDTNKIAALLGVLKLNFNLIVVDLPFYMLERHQDILIQIDRIGLCMSNNLYSIVNTAQLLSNDFSPNMLAIFKAKTKVVITKMNENNRYNGRKLNTHTVMALWKNIAEDWDMDIEFAGVIPTLQNYDLQQGSDFRVALQNNEMINIFTSLLMRLLK